MNKKAIYRQWRPQNFDDIIAQDHVVKSLKNQIENGTYNHAYVFSGTRGTGKTSTAKIFAKAVNCINPQEGNPCNVCEICRGINEETIIDVVEMDAASNNSVDDIRELRENVKYAPSKAKHKVYIIDEVHMLSIGAFNALLKTLEEPPAYVVFILATTEPHKIPDTIMSRCQKYEFKRASQTALLKRLEEICVALERPYETDALNKIIQKSGGSVRDTFSALDQVLNAGYDKITKEVVDQSLGLIDEMLMIHLIENLYLKNTLEVLEAINQVISSGKDLIQFINGLINTCRDMMIKTIISGEYKHLIHSSDYVIDCIDEATTKVPSHEITRILDGLVELSGKIKYQEHKRTVIEMDFIKLMHPVTKEDVSSLLKRIEVLENQINKMENQPFSDGDYYQPKREVGNQTKEEKSDYKVNQPSEITSEQPAVFNESSQSVTEMNQPVEKIKEEQKEKTPIEQKEQMIETEKVNEFVEVSGDELALTSVQSRWSEFLSKVRKDNPTIYPLIQKSYPCKISGNRLSIGVQESSLMFLPIINKVENLEYMKKRTSQFYKKSLDISYEIVKEKVLSEEDQLRDFLGKHQDVLEIKS